MTIRTRLLAFALNINNLHLVVVNLELIVQETSSMLKEACRKELSRFKLQEATLRQSIVSIQLVLEKDVECNWTRMQLGMAKQKF